MTLPVGYNVLQYRGHFRCEVGLSYKDAILSTEYGGGFREDENIFPPLRTAALSYPTLHKDAMTRLAAPSILIDRLTYIWDFYAASKDAGNKPFLMKTPNRATSQVGRYFLWVFEDSDLTIELVDLYMGSTGLRLRQVYVRGLTGNNADGSFNP